TRLASYPLRRRRGRVKLRQHDRVLARVAHAAVQRVLHHQRLLTAFAAEQLQDVGARRRVVLTRATTAEPARTPRRTLTRPAVHTTILPAPRLTQHREPHRAIELMARPGTGRAIRQCQNRQLPDAVLRAVL